MFSKREIRPQGSHADELPPEEDEIKTSAFWAILAVTGVIVFATLLFFGSMFGRSVEKSRAIVDAENGVSNSTLLKSYEDRDAALIGDGQYGKNNDGSFRIPVSEAIDILVKEQSLKPLSER